MFSFDASSMIHVWDNYPPENSHFNSLWTWLAEQITSHEFSISVIAFNEVNHKIPECGQWLKNNDIQIYPLTASVLSMAQQIKTNLGIVEEKYTKGVSENDLLIISTAKETQTTLVSEENRQNILPPLKSNYKIPAVCSMLKVNVKCISFVDLLR